MTIEYVASVTPKNGGRQAVTIKASSVSDAFERLQRLGYTNVSIQGYPGQEAARLEYAEAVVADLTNPECGRVQQGSSVLKIEGESYVMFKDRGAYRPHRLDISCTTPLRLLAHWEGFTGRTLA